MKAKKKTGTWAWVALAVLVPTIVAANANDKSGSSAQLSRFKGPYALTECVTNQHSIYVFDKQEIAKACAGLKDAGY
jgi:hypothetical protein